MRTIFIPRAVNFRQDVVKVDVCGHTLYNPFGSSPHVGGHGEVSTLESFLRGFCSLLDLFVAVLVDSPLDTLLQRENHD